MAVSFPEDSLMLRTAAVLCLLGCAGITFGGDVGSSAGDVGFHLIEEPVNPYLIAMGSAGTAMGGPGFAYYNPALPFFAEHPYLYVDYGRYPQGDLQRAYLELAFPVGEWRLGASLHTQAIDNIIRTDWLGNLLNKGESTSAQITVLAMDATFSKWERFALGGTFSVVKDRIMHYAAYALSLSVGAVYTPVPGHLSLGLSGQHLLQTSTRMDTTRDWGEGYRLPLTARLGVAWRDTVGPFPYAVSFDIVYRNVRDTSKGFTENIAERFTVPLGVEFRPLPALGFRMGKRINHPTEIINWGVGVDFDVISINSSFVVPKLVEDTELKWLVSLTYMLRPKPVAVKEHERAVEELVPADTGATPAAESSIAEPNVAPAPTGLVPLAQDTLLLPERSPDSPKEETPGERALEETGAVSGIDSSTSETSLPLRDELPVQFRGSDEHADQDNGPAGGTEESPPVPPGE